MSLQESYLLQKEYIQKSKIFLFPLIGIQSSKYFRPTNTYVACKDLISEAYPDGISYDDNILIVVYSKKYKKEDDEIHQRIKEKNILSSNDNITGWRKFEIEYLLKNPRFLAFHEDEEEYIYTYDLSEYSNDWNCFIKGKYSLLSEGSKKKIIDFRWKALSKEARNKLYCYLYPDKEECMDAFANELAVKEKDKEQVKELLIGVKELCSKPNLSLETYKCLLIQPNETES